MVTFFNLGLDLNVPHVPPEQQHHSLHKNLAAFAVADTMERGQPDLARHRKGRPSEHAPLLWDPVEQLFDGGRHGCSLTGLAFQLSVASKPAVALVRAMTTPASASRSNENLISTSPSRQFFSEPAANSSRRRESFNAMSLRLSPISSIRWDNNSGTAIRGARSPAVDRRGRTST